MARKIDKTWTIGTMTGAKGDNGESIEIEYSINGSSSWHSVFTSGDKYMRQKVGTGDWSSAIKIVGEDGKDSTVPGPRGFSSRTIAYRVNYSAFATAGNGQVYICGYNNDGEEADVAGYVIVNDTTHYVKGVCNPGAAVEGYIAIPIGSTSSKPVAPVAVYTNILNNKWYKLSAGTSTEITASSFIVLGSLVTRAKDASVTVEEITPALLSSQRHLYELNYKGLVVKVEDNSASITPYKVTVDNNEKFTITVLSATNAKRGSVVMEIGNATKPTKSTIRLFNGTKWETATSTSNLWSEIQNVMAGNLPGIAGWYDSFEGVNVPDICGTYFKTLTANKAFINSLFANDIIVGEKIHSANDNFILDKDGKAIFNNVEINTGSATDTGVAISGGGWTNKESTTGFGITKNGDIYSNNGQFRGILGESYIINGIIDQGVLQFDIPEKYRSEDANFKVSIYCQTIQNIFYLRWTSCIKKTLIY